jgi:hypothetical protein
MTKVKMVGPVMRGKEEWVTTTEAPRGGPIEGGDVVFAYVSKHQSGAVYPSLAVSLGWRKDEEEYASEIMDALVPELRRVGLELRDEIISSERVVQIWFRPTHSAQDNVRLFERACNSTFDRDELGYLWLKE